ncbi:MAG: SigE family RNA polymerase sigma factor [Acidimicrobiaceae bacterium]|nr:SigE family RNA polymerase sigma factor [Acidimicrobiaceae bacterium]
MSRRPLRRRDDGFDAFAATMTPDLLRTASLTVWDPSIAEDVVQECLFQVARRWSRVRRMEYPAAYARRIAINLAIAAAERRTTEGAELAAGLEFEPVDAAARHVLEHVDYHHDLDAALGRLAPRQRAVLVLRFFEDLTEPQTAELLGCSVGTVKSTCSRALDRLRSDLHYERTILPDSTTSR